MNRCRLRQGMAFHPERSRRVAVPKSVPLSGVLTPEVGLPRLEIYPVQLCHLNSTYLVENKRPASVLPGTDSHVFFFVQGNSRSLVGRKAASLGMTTKRKAGCGFGLSANQFLIATKIIRNGPKSFNISSGTRSNRNKTDDPMRIGTLRESARLDDRRISLLTTRLINF